MTDKETKEPLFVVPMPGGRVARVPLEVLQKYLDAQGNVCHGERAPVPEPKKGNVTVNVYAHDGQVRVETEEEADDDVEAHSLSFDPTTGVSDWHFDWEFGECVTRRSGFPERLHAWHRHPFGNEYTEIYEP